MPNTDLLKLTLTPGLGPVLTRRALERFGSVDRVLGASARELELVRGIGAGTSERIVRGLRESAGVAEREIERCERHGVRIVAAGEAGYPELLTDLPDAPLLLYVRGDLDRAAMRRTVAIVGSRGASAYGIEQAERFAGVLSGAGYRIVSGGARGIDTAAHRGAIRVRGQTVAVLGCGLGRCYPPENRDLFDRIVGEGGAVVSELPMEIEPVAENFPARNRIISGLSLGVVVIEAGRRSGALITARLAAEEHGREVMALPGRVDSGASIGTHELLKQGGAMLVTEPPDVIELLEGPSALAQMAARDAQQEGGVPEPAGDPVLDALCEPLTLDELVDATGLGAGAVQSALTLLEIQGRVRRAGPRVERTR